MNLPAIFSRPADARGNDRQTLGSGSDVLGSTGPKLRAGNIGEAEVETDLSI